MLRNSIQEQLQAENLLRCGKPKKAL